MAPLRLGGEQGTVCIPVAGSHEYTYAFDAIENTTDASIEVSTMRLVGAERASMVAAYVAPIYGRTLMGAMPGWPPENGTPPAFNAKAAVPTLLKAHDSANIVLHVTADPPATIQAVEVRYLSGGRVMRVRNSTTLEIRGHCR